MRGVIDKKQIRSCRLPLTRLRLPVNKLVGYLVSHSFGIGFLYTVIGLFWLAMFVMSV